MKRSIIVAAGILVSARLAVGQIVGPPGYIVGSIPLPGVAQGDVVVVGASVVVGQGSFGGGTESVIRQDPDGTVTTLATGFNSLGSFALSHGGDLLFVTDNGGEQSGATTGDTVFAIDDPRTATASVTAAGREVAAPGTIPNAQGLAVGPDGEVYASDASGSTNGKVLRHRSFLYPPFVTFAAGFGYTAGLAFGPSGHLFVGDVNASNFEGRVVELDTTGAFVRTLASGLSGAFDQEFDTAGNLLVSGGSTSDFSSTIVSIDPAGTVTEFAHGFTFTGGLTVDPLGGRVYALDFGKSTITTFTPVAELLPGGGRAGTDCFAEFSSVPAFVNRRGHRTHQSRCRDGSACDRDRTADGVCTFAVGVCFNVPGSSDCTSSEVDNFEVLPIHGVVDPQFDALQTAAGAVLPSTTAECVGPVSITVPVGSVKLLRTAATFEPTSGLPKQDRDSLVLRCMP